MTRATQMKYEYQKLGNIVVAIQRVLHQMVYVAVAMLVTNTIASLGIIVVRYRKSLMIMIGGNFHSALSDDD